MRGFPGHHMYGPRLFAGSFSFLISLLILGLLIYLVMLARRNAGPATVVKAADDTPAVPRTGPMTPAEVVKMRYARGEITKEEYDTMRKDLE